MGYKTYDAGTTGGDSLNWDEKKVGDCPQRGNRPALDLSPENSVSDFDSPTHLPSGDFYGTDWKDPIGAQYCQNDYDDLGRNPLNEPVKQRKNSQYPETGWQTVASDISGTSEKGGGTDGTEKR